MKLQLLQRLCFWMVSRTVGVVVDGGAMQVASSDGV